MANQKAVAVITGAAGGLGFALAEQCLHQGMDLVIADNQVDLLAEKAKTLSRRNLGLVTYLYCDVTVPESVGELVKLTYDTFGRVDYLYNNAGIIGKLAPLWEQKFVDLQKVLAVNLEGVIHVAQQFLPLMIAQEHRSHLINVSSFYGLCSGSHVPGYAMSKHAIVALSESLYFDLHRLHKPVDVSVVCPSFIHTSLLNYSFLSDGSELHALMSQLMTHGRPAKDVAHDIINAVSKKVFYILPDKEVNDYCTQRVRAIVDQEPPFMHAVERIIASLSRRIQARTVKE
ncbi:MAG: SDR family NAD(P)-dependent oxidoreductase [Legionella sp.]